MVQTIEKKLTLKEFLQLPETKPASEYIEEGNDKLSIPDFLPELNLTVGEIFNWLKYSN